MLCFRFLNCPMFLLHGKKRKSTLVESHGLNALRVRRLSLVLIRQNLSPRMVCTKLNKVICIFSIKVICIFSINLNANCHSFTLDRRSQNSVDNAFRKERDDLNKLCLDSHRERMLKEKLRGNDLAQVKGGFSWLSSLPLKEEGKGGKRTLKPTVLAKITRPTLGY